MPVVALQVQPVQQVPEAALPAAHMAHPQKLIQGCVSVNWSRPAENAERSTRTRASRIRNFESEPQRTVVAELRPIEVYAALVFAFDDESIIQVAHRQPG